jgi:ribosomal protein L11 methyltransferase
VKLKKDSYWELAFEITRGDESQKTFVYDFLGSFGFSYDEIVFFESPEQWRVGVYTKNPNLLKKVRSKIKKLPRSILFSSRVLTPKDWRDKWQIEYRMQPLTRNLMLVPEWEMKKYRGKRTPLYLDPKSVFGSGTHPSTRLMIEILEKCRGQFESMLDLGTGTGILSVAGYRFGAKEIWCVDEEVQSVRTAKFNLRLNGYKRGKFLRADLRAVSGFKKSFDLVAANLFTALLIQIRNLIFESVRPGGYLALSGIDVKNLPELQKNFKHSDFQCLFVKKRKGWAGLLYQRRGAEVQSQKGR